MRSSDTERSAGPVRTGLGAMAGSVAAALAMAGASVVVGQGAGAADLGRLQLLLSMGLLLAELLAVGVSPVLTGSLAQGHIGRGTAEVIRLQIIVRSGRVLVVAVLAPAFLALLLLGVAPIVAAMLLLATVAWGVSNGLANLRMATDRGLGDYRSTILFIPVTRFALFGSLFAALPFGLTGLCSAVLVASIPGISFGGAGLIRSRRLLLERSAEQTEIARSARPALVGSLLQEGSYRLDLVLVGILLGATEAGVYSVALLVAQMAWLPANVLAQLVVSSELPNPARSRLVLRYGVTAIAITATAMTVAALLAFAGVEQIYGLEFTAVPELVLLLLPGSAALSFWKVRVSDLVAHGEGHVKLITSAVGLVATILGNLVLIPQYGVHGSAVASSLAYFMTTVALIMIGSNRRSSPGRSGFWATV